MTLQIGTLAHTADDHGNSLTAAGLALETIATLLGERQFSEEQMYGLTCAVHSIGTAVRGSGFELCNAVEQEGEAMNKKPTNLAQVANDAVDHLEVVREHLGWLDSIGHAISSALKSGHTDRARQLAGLTQYLASDLNNMLDDEVSSLNERLAALDLRA